METYIKHKIAIFYFSCSHKPLGQSLGLLIIFQLYLSIDYKARWFDLGPGCILS